MSWNRPSSPRSRPGHPGAPQQTVRPRSAHGPLGRCSGAAAASVALVLGVALWSPAAADAHPLWSMTAEGAVTVVQDADGWQLEQDAFGQQARTVRLPADVALRPAHLSRARLDGREALLLLSVRAPAGANDDREQLDIRVLDPARLEAANGPSLPAPEVDGLLVTPRVLVDGDGAPTHLLWIEGRTLQATAVRAARWTGAGWSRPQTLSPVGPGTQTALSAVTLANGDALAAWAAFDGEDDEILWSRFDGRAWSEPRAVSSNTVPDVTPTLHALDDGGALVAWSAYDGRDYRIGAATFDGRAWSEPTSFGGAGSVSPYFARGAATPTLVFLQTLPAAWVTTELGADATALRSATSQRNLASAERAALRPMVLGADDDGVRLAWPQAAIFERAADETGTSAGTSAGEAKASSIELAPWDSAAR